MKTISRCLEEWITDQEKNVKGEVGRCLQICRSNTQLGFEYGFPSFGMSILSDLSIKKGEYAELLGQSRPYWVILRKHLHPSRQRAYVV